MSTCSRAWRANCFSGSWGVLFCIAVVSGVVLYGPYMKKIPFGSVRGERSARIKWLDLHNLLGVVTLAWAFVVGFTGVINELSTPMFKYWQATAMLQTLLAPYQGKGGAAPRRNELRGRRLRRRPEGAARHEGQCGDVPGQRVRQSVSLPVLAQRRYRADVAPVRSGAGGCARTGVLGAQLEMPWYLRALEVSRPLHFGDYAGMPLKIIWAVLDLVTIIVLGSGVYLWVARRKSAAARLAELEARHKAWSQGLKA